MHVMNQSVYALLIRWVQLFLGKSYFDRLRDADVGFKEPNYFQEIPSKSLPKARGVRKEAMQEDQVDSIRKCTT